MADDQSYAAGMVAEAERLIAAGNVRRAIRKLEGATAATSLAQTDLFDRIRRAADAAAHAKGGRYAKQAALIVRIADAREASLQRFASRNPTAETPTASPPAAGSGLREAGIGLAIGGLVLGFILALALGAADDGSTAVVYGTRAINGAPGHFNWLFFLLPLGTGVIAGSALYAAGAVVSALDAARRAPEIASDSG